MLYKEDEKGVCIIIIYIDDMLIIGKEEAIEDAIKSIARSFSSERSNEIGRLFRCSNCAKS